MLKIMANENMDDWKATPQVIDETVRVTKQFLEDHPEEYKKVTPTGGNLDKIGFKTISSFLGWPESRVSHSLERLKMIDDDKVEQRKEIAKKLSELEASQRATAKMLGVGVATINRDTNPVPSGTIEVNNTTEYEEVINDIVPFGTPSEIPSWIEESGPFQKCRNRHYLIRQQTGGRLFFSAEATKIPLT